MKEKVLNALVHLFAIVAGNNGPDYSLKAREILKNYFQGQLNQKAAARYISLFINFLTDYLVNTVQIDREKIINEICNEINNELSIREKAIVILKLLEFSNIDGNISESEKAQINQIALTLNIDQNDFSNLYYLIVNTDLIQKDSLLIIDSKDITSKNEGNWFGWIQTEEDSVIRHIFREDMQGQMFFLFLKTSKLLLFKYSGSQILFLQGKTIIREQVYTFNPGNILTGQKIKPIYYSDVVNEFLIEKKQTRIVLNARNIEYSFKGNQKGIHPFSFSIESGKLVGIMGGSGVGKSTLFHILSGKLKPNAGEITINEYDIYKKSQNVEGIIGYVPQDDLLFEELTVFQNLFYNACLCFGYLSRDQIKAKVEKMLQDLELFEIKDLTVGNPLKKIISGGQRKRLNIALELIREPYILFIDEPTSGLSSKDAERMMHLLKEQTLKGKLVIINIHQPSSEVYKLFDKLWVMDKGGRIVYQGNPLEALEYFKINGLKANTGESECQVCGNINAEQIFEILEEKELDEYGRYSSQRKILPEEWYHLYKTKIENQLELLPSEKKLPVNFFRIPDFDKQFIIFSIRNFLTKLNNRQYLIINLIEAPILAFFLAFFSKYIQSGTYYFGDNKNIPAYLFMSVVVSLFLGMIVSAEEIIKDRKIIERESFLNLSRFSYINSKVLFLFGLSALQMFIFVLVGNYILAIKGMTFSYWIVLFSAACFANLAGLLISSTLDSVVAVYISIPFLLVPQILLSGTVVPFDNLHPALSKRQYVPFMGDLMASRWAYEALMVEQFKKNGYEKIFFKIEQEKSNANYKSSFLIPRIEQKIEENLKWMHQKPEEEKIISNFYQILHGIKTLTAASGLGPFEYAAKLNPNDFNDEIAEETMDYLQYLKMQFASISNQAERQYDSIISKMETDYGKDYIINLRRTFFNKTVADYVLNRWELNKIYELPDKIIQKKDPIYMVPESNYGRAHFYAPVKIFFSQVYDTIQFNVVIIWIMIIILYILLIFDILRKMLSVIQKPFFHVITSVKRIT